MQTKYPKPEWLSPSDVFETRNLIIKKWLFSFSVNPYRNGLSINYQMNWLKYLAKRER